MPPLEAPRQMWLLPFLHSSPAVAALARLDTLRPRWMPYSRTDLNTVGDAHTTTTPCPEVASPTRVSGNIGNCCFSPSASLAPADNVRESPPDQRSSAILRYSRLGGRTRANALCPDQMLPTSCQSAKKRGGTNAIPTITKKATDTSRGVLWNPRGRPFSPPSRPSGTEQLPSLLYPFSALFPLPS